MINFQKQFLALLPQRPLLVGVVLAVSGGTALVELPDGVQIHVRGSATVGQRVFVRDGAIEGVAPDLQYVFSEV